MEPLKRGLFGVGLFLCLVGCTTTTIVEEEEIPADSVDNRSPSQEKGTTATAPTTGSATIKGATATDDEVVAACAAKTSLEDCTSCCELTATNVQDCSAKASCETMDHTDDCRSGTACGADEACVKCWGGWTCLATTSKC